MPVKSYENTQDGEPTTQGAGNAGGKPIIPILLGVVAVIALILVTLSLQGKTNSQNASTAASNQQIARDSSPPIAGGTVRQTTQTERVAPSGPATAPVSPRTNGSETPLTTTPAEVGSGRNIVAPPGPAANSVPGTPASR